MEILNRRNMESRSEEYSDENEKTIPKSRSKILEFYKDRSILITGGSGFVGKVLIEKLLRSCPDIKRIFVLIRPKWNKKPQERLSELLKAPLFDCVRKSINIEEKVIVVEGDVMQLNLGLNDQDLLTIMNEVSVIYHSAATVKFDEPLKQSVAINITGTKNMLEVCRKIPQLAALVHVSTAYANCDKEEIDEHIYPLEMNPEKLVELAGWLDQETLQELKVRLLGSRPNTYTYTKALAEWLLFKCARDLPVVICRPSIVVASWKEPFEGWIDNVNGPTGIILGAGKGLIRSMYAESSCVADLIPVDTVINMIITLGWFAHVYRKQKTQSIAEDSAESSTESLVYSNSDTSLDGLYDECSNRGMNNESFMEMNYGSNNNNNNSSNFNTEDESREFQERKMNANGNSQQYLYETIRQQPDEGYSSQMSDEKLSSASSSPTTSPSPILSWLRPLNSNSNVQTSNSTSDMKERKATQSNEKIISFMDKKRIAEQKNAAFEYKLKQFRHKTQTKLAAKNLPEELADVPVFHCTTGDKNPITWGQINVLIISILALFPSISTYRYPCGSFTNKKRLDKFYRITLHYIPGYIFDFITKLSGGKPILVKIFRKFDQAANVLQAFTSKQWKFNSENGTMLVNELMSEEDKRLFNCDVSTLDWADFLRGYVLGVRQFLLKEPSSNLEDARRKLKVVYYRNLSLQVIFFASFFYYICPPVMVSYFL